jgi:hypothetical protein
VRRASLTRAIVTVVLVVAGVLVVDMLGDLTQTRGDPIVPGSRSEVTLEVDAQRYKHDLDAAANHLVAACAGTTGSVVLADPGVERVESGVYRFTVRPSLGAENRRKLTGCLEDFTVDRLLAQVTSVETIAP